MKNQMKSYKIRFFPEIDSDGFSLSRLSCATRRALPRNRGGTTEELERNRGGAVEHPPCSKFRKAQRYPNYYPVRNLTSYSSVGELSQPQPLHPKFQC